jgi:hypothetical protein
MGAGGGAYSGQGSQQSGLTGSSFEPQGFQGGGMQGSQGYGGRGMQSGRSSHTGRGPKGYRRSDERIEEEINELLTRHPEIDASEIEVQVKNGEVTLTGTVDERHAKRLAEDIAEQCSGVNEVHNQIRVSKGGGGISDREVTRSTEREGRSETAGASGGEGRGRASRSTSSSAGATSSGGAGASSTNPSTTGGSSS